MLVSARKQAFAALAFAVSVFNAAPVNGAGANALDAEAIGLTDATPLQDAQMDELRGKGFLSGFLPSLINSLPFGNAGFLGDLLPSLINGSPPGNAGFLSDLLPSSFGTSLTFNLVFAQIGESSTMLFGVGAQSLSCGNGLACPDGTMITVFAGTKP